MLLNKIPTTEKKKVINALIPLYWRKNGGGGGGGQVSDVAEGLNQVCTQTTAGLIPQPGVTVATKVNQQVHRHNKWLAQCSTCLLFISFCKLLFFLLHCCIYMCVCVGGGGIK